MSKAIAIGNGAGCSMVAPSFGLRRTPTPKLSEREVEVLLTWLRFDSKERAAAALYISAATVNTHIARIRRKYADAGRAAPTKAQLVARALQDGYTTLEQW